MTAVYALSLLLVLALAGYLVVALFKPEKFG
jgi:K+-transporting ATPase KdpF subunit